MLSDLLLVAGVIALIVAAFLVSIILGVALVGVACLGLSIALSDGKGLSWRS